MLHHLLINTVNHFEYRCSHVITSVFKMVDSIDKDGVALKELNSLEKGFNQPKH